MPALDDRDLARPNPPPAGAVAVANEEAVRAWDTVLYERWKSNRKVFVGALAGVTKEVFKLFPPPECGCCIDIGCGFDEIELHQRDFDYFMGADMDEAVDSLLAIGPGAELIRLNGEYGESRRGEIAEALRDHYAAWQKPDGSIVGRGSVWIVAATNPA